MVGGWFAIVLVVMVATRHLSHRISEGGSQRTHWNTDNHYYYRYITVLYQPRANLVSLGSLILHRYEAVSVGDGGMTWAL